MPDTLPHEQDLLLFHFGPVQEFIEQARSCRDLWSGSYLLSWLTAHALKAVTDNIEAGTESIVFPCLSGNGIFSALQGSTDAKSGEQSMADWLLTPTLPNRFLAIVPPGSGPELAGLAKQAISKELVDIAENVWNWLKNNGAADAWKARFDAQVAAFPQTAWAVHPWSECASGLLWSKRYEKLEARLAARRNTRDFAQWSCDSGAAVKDSLSGKEECIGDEAFWKKLAKEYDKIFTAGSHRYGAMNLIKRLWCRDDCVPYLRNKLGLEKKREAYLAAMRFENTEEIARNNIAVTQPGQTKPEASKNGYIAILSMDGDEMGKTLSSLNAPDDHVRFSEALANFATSHAGAIVKQHDGELLYAGGDDVLAILPASRAVECAKELRGVFRECLDACELSGGIAVGHHKAPLQILIAEARTALARAKDGYGRSALAVSVYKRSGETLKWGCKWDSPALELLKTTAEHSFAGKLSGRFPYALAEFLSPYRFWDGKTRAVEDDALKGAVAKDFEQVLARQGYALEEKEREAFRDLALQYVESIPEGRLTDFLNLFLVEAFLDRYNKEA